MGGALFETVCAEVAGIVMKRMEAEGENPSKAAVAVETEINVREVIAERGYPDSYSDRMIARDIRQSLIPAMVGRACADFDAIGMQGEISHSEAGVSRTYAADKRTRFPVRPLAKVC